MAIIISESGKAAEKLERTIIEKEEFLQEYIFENPEVLPLEEYKDDIRLLVLAREFPSASGPIDAVGVDHHGELYLIETKLYKNPDKRLVLAQVLDYGAALWKEYGDTRLFLEELEKRIAAGPRGRLNDLLREHFDLDEEGIETLREAMRENVEAGSFRFVILMDRMEDRLKDLIHFMNQNSRFDVFGVELDFYRHGEMEILIPRLYGTEVKKTVGRGSSTARREWNEETFFGDASERLTSEEVEAIRRLYEWSTKQADLVKWGTGLHTGSFNPRFDHICPRSVFSVMSDGYFSLNFGWMRDEPGRTYAQTLVTKLQDSGTLDFPPDFLTRYPGFPVSQWREVIDPLVSILDETLTGQSA